MKKYLYTFAFILSTVLAFSQSEKVVHPTPEAASLIKMSQNELTLQTGSASIGIPLYTLSEGGLTVPIGLSYSGSSGIKVDEAATWVGLGWDLNAGGQITRIVRDKPDESYTMNDVRNERGGVDGVQVGFLAGSAKFSVDWKKDKIIYRAGWHRFGDVFNNTNPYYNDFKNNDPVLFDTAPDLYIANLGGRIVKFTYDNSFPPKPVVLNNQDVKIEEVYQEYNPAEYYTEQEWSVSASVDAMNLKLDGKINNADKTQLTNAGVSGQSFWQNKLNSMSGKSGIGQSFMLGVTVGLDQFFRKTKNNKSIIGYRKWIITTSDGVQYHFGEDDSNAEDSDYLDKNFNYQNLLTCTDRLSIAVTNLHSKIPSAWHLKKIVSPYGLKDLLASSTTEIAFTYEKTGFYSPYNATDVLVDPKEGCEAPKSEQNLFNTTLNFFANGVVAPDLEIPKFEDFNLNFGVSYTQNFNQNDAFVELNNMVVYGKNLKTIESPNFKIIFNSENLFAQKDNTDKFKRIISGYNRTQFSEVDRKDIQGEAALSTEEIKKNSVVNFSGTSLTYKSGFWQATYGSTPSVSFDNGNVNASLGFTGFYFNWQGKVYKDNLIKPYLHKPYSLKNIEIYDKTAQVSKAYYFDYDYFAKRIGVNYLDESDLPSSYYPALHAKYSEDLPEDKYRLRLKGIYEMVIKPNEISLLPGYSFEYNNIPLPRRLSMAQDHWGYYNGEHANRDKSQFIARMTYNTYDVGGNLVTTGGAYTCPYSSNRDANLTFCKAGIIEKITYPTGGKKEFVYELHSADNFPKPIGGLRVKEIITSDPVLNKTYTEAYSYVKSGTTQSSGVLSIYPEYQFRHTDPTIPKIVHADYVNHLLGDFVNDNYILYKRVVTRQVGNGYSVTEFNLNEKPALKQVGLYGTYLPTNIGVEEYTRFVDETPTTQTILGYVDVNNYAILNEKPAYDYSKGSIDKVSVFTENNKIVSETKYIYTPNAEITKQTISAADVIRRLPLRKLSVGVQIGVFFMVHPPFVLPSVSFDARMLNKKSGEVYPYTINVGKFHLDKQINKSFDLNGENPIVSEVNFEYSPKHHEVVKQTAINSNGDVVESIKKFSFDFPTDTVAFVFQTPTTFSSEYLPRLNKKGRYMNLLIEELTKRNGLVVSGKVNLFHDDDGFANLKAGLLKEEYVLEISKPIYDLIETKNFVKFTLNYNFPNGETTYESFLGFDSRYKLRSQYTEYNNRGLLTKSNKVGFPSSKITYGYNNLIPIQVTQETSKGDRSVNYELIPLYGVTRTINPDGTELKYKYDPVGRLLEIRDKNGKLVKSYQYNYKAQ